MTTTTYQRIIQRAEAEKQRKQEANDAFISTRTFRQNEKHTSQYSGDKHQTPVDPDAMFSGKVQDSLAIRTTEHEALKIAGGLAAYEEQPPLVETPNKFKTRIDRKRCSNCKAWKPTAEFSKQKRKNGNEFLQSWCKECAAEYAREQYGGLNKRIP